ncbi:MAG TPA: zinc-binding dehydrogenase [Gemmatimonadaceae bacterium]|nr:zinc-binding dehydrogenase [Gemmatimonadaceae bacterium]
MRALTLSGHGGLEKLEYRDDLPVPELRDDGDVRIRVVTGALNHLDLFVIRGLPGITISPGWVLGADAAGVIDVVGAEVQGLAAGDPVVINPGISCRRCEFCLEGDQPLCLQYGILGEHLPGTFAEYVVVPATNVRRFDPARASWEEAAAFPLATLTAWRMVVSRARVAQGDEVLIWGIGGGVAQAALQIARALGARVWVTSGSDAKLERARGLGAAETLNHAAVDVAREIRTRTGKRGVDVVIDNVGEQTWTKSLGALGRSGRLVTCGATSGPIVQTDVRRLFWNQWTIMGSTMGNDAEFDAIVAELRAGRLLPPVDSAFPLHEARAAFERLAAGEQFGKVVLRIGEP